MFPARDTIFALSSGRLPAAIAVVRISGPGARAALEVLSGKVPEPRRASLARLRDPASHEVIDEALALWFPCPRSETGEDMAELQLHGGRAVLAAVVAALGRLEGFRPAEPGEFTRRAFENGRLDLTAVEGLADLIGAETEAQRRQAYRQMKGLLGDRAETWRTRIIQALALVEAGIDFSDEADVPDELLGPALEIARGLHGEMSQALAHAGRGERLRDGFVVAIAGPPNAGKSTLLNRIARREAAIVSPHAGTTRDVIEVHLDLGGYPVTLLDTAGVRETDDPVEQEGVRRARERAASADLVLWITDARKPMTEFEGQWPMKNRPLGPQNGSLAEATGPTPTGSLQPGRARGPEVKSDNKAGPLADGPAIWVVRNKIDLLGESEGPAFARPKLPSAARPASPPPGAEAISQFTPAPLRGSSSPASTDREHRSENQFITEQKVISLSSLSGEGVEEFLRRLESHVGAYFARESGLVTRERHRLHLEAAKDALSRALNDTSRQEEIVAEELRIASRALGRLTGKVDVEDILDAIFRDFCIGK